MVQTLLLILFFVAAILLLPWAMRRWQAQRALGQGAHGVNTKVVSAVAIGPQQRVMIIEVGPEDARTWLVLGVTAQQIQCLHAFPRQSDQSNSKKTISPTEFSHEISALMAERGEHS